MTSSARESILAPMDEQALERARRRIAEARTDGIGAGRLDAALERARAEMMRLAQVARRAREHRCRSRSAIAVRDGIAREVVPVSRSLARDPGRREPVVYGGSSGSSRSCSRSGTRGSTTLRILVELVSAGWSGVDAGSEARGGNRGRVVPLPAAREMARPPDQASRRRRRPSLRHRENHGAGGRPGRDRDEYRQVLTRSVSGSSPRPRRCSSRRYRTARTRRVARGDSHSESCAASV